MVNEVKDRTVAEFFAGIGLMRAGLEQAGWTVVFANDIDPTKKRLYVNHFQQAGNHFLLDDIRNISADDIPTVSLATASFPCTDLSLAGRRAGLNGEQSSAFWGFVNILRGMNSRKPPLILLENVTGFLTSNNGKDFCDALKALNDLGYAVDAVIINAANFVPQSRVRLFIIGKLSRDGSKIVEPFPRSELRPAKLADFMVDHPEIIWKIQQGLPELPKLQRQLADVVDEIPKGSAVWFTKERVDYLLNQTFDRHLLRIFEQKKRNYYEYFTAFRRVRNGKSMAEIRFDGIAGCLRTPKGGSARQILLKVGKGKVEIRLLTPRECARLMGAENYTLSGTATEALFGFGDAVCVPVISWIAENYLNNALKETLGNKLKHFEEYSETP